MKDAVHTSEKLGQLPTKVRQARGASILRGNASADMSVRRRRAYPTVAAHRSASSAACARAARGAMAAIPVRRARPLVRPGLRAVRLAAVRAERQ